VLAREQQAEETARKNAKLVRNKPLCRREDRNLVEFQPLFRVNIPIGFRFSRTELRRLKRQLLVHKKARYASNAGTTFNGLFDVPPKREQVRAEICEGEHEV
jgi:hypothetical protein